jgi:hypothetical protein
MLNLRQEGRKNGKLEGNCGDVKFNKLELGG